MNRYVKQGLCLDMAQGKRVLVVSDSRARSRAVFEELAKGAPDSARVYRAVGRERLSHPTGGSISFLIPSALRGHEADVVFDETGHEDAHLCVAARGELVRP